MVALDHVFVCTAVAAPEADRLVAFGLTEGTASSHPGQGTANRRFFFRNAVLELLWVHDEHEARSPVVAPPALGAVLLHRVLARRRLLPPDDATRHNPTGTTVHYVIVSPTLSAIRPEQRRCWRDG